MNETLFLVVGVDDLEDIVFARCTTYEKAQRAMELLENEGFENMVHILQDNIVVDVVEINGKFVEL